MTLHKVQIQREPDVFVYVDETSWAMKFHLNEDFPAMVEHWRTRATYPSWEPFGHYVGKVTAEIREGE